MKQFDLVLKNEKERSYRTITLFLFVLNFISILYLTYLTNFTRWGSLIIACATLLVVFSTYYFKNKNQTKTFIGAFFLFSLAWINSDYWIVSILNVLFMLLNTAVLQTPIVNINEEEVIYPSFPKRKFSWKDLNNLILKDGLLTIDFKNNKLIQQSVAETSSTINEKEFNEFCKQQLNK